MKVAFYSAKPYEQSFFDAAASNTDIQFNYIEQPLDTSTVNLSQGYQAVCCFVTDNLDADVLNSLHRNGIRLIALRSTGYDHVDLNKAHELGMTVMNVPGYSPYAVAEFAVGLLLSIVRKIHQAHQLVQANNFLLDSQLGKNLNGMTVGVIGTGNIGSIFCHIMQGFGCHVMAYDPEPNNELSVNYVSLDELFKQSDVIGLHCPLNEATHYIVNSKTIQLMKDGVIIINTGRGPLIDTQALIDGLRSGKVGGAGLDVYENEKGLFFSDHSHSKINDAMFLKLKSYENVLVTGHQAYLTAEALNNIATITMTNLVSDNSNNQL